MVPPMAHSGITDVFREGVDLRHLRHRPMKRAVEAGDLRQARERLGERPCAAHVKGLVRRLDRHQRIEVVQHLAIDPDRRFETGATEYDAMAGRDYLRVQRDYLPAR